MTFGSWFGGGAGVSGGSPTRRSWLRLEALDERAVPDGNPGSPPGGPPGQTDEPAQYTTADLQVGRALYLDSAGDTNIHYSRLAETDGWVMAVNVVTGDFSATQVNYPAAVVPGAADGYLPGFTPDPTLPTAVWDPNTGTYSTVPAGTAFGAVSGKTAGGWNAVVLPLAAGFDPAAARSVAVGGGAFVGLERAADPAVPPGSTKLKITRPDGTQGPTVIIPPGGVVIIPPGGTLQVEPNGDLTLKLPPATGQDQPQNNPPRRTKPEEAPPPRPAPPAVPPSAQKAAEEAERLRRQAEQDTDAGPLEQHGTPGPRPR